MTQNTIIKKGLIVGIVLLFLTIGFSPIINADDNTIPQIIGDVPIAILEYKRDGTVEKTVVRMSREQAGNFHEEMRNAQDLDARLSIYEKYNLISQDITVDTLRTGMQEKAQRMGLTQDKLEHMVKKNRRLFNKQIYVNLFCFVSGRDEIELYGGYRIIPFGTSLIQYLIYGLPIISFDVLDFIIGLLHFESKGVMSSIQGSFEGTIIMVGFVGFIYYYPEWVGHGMKFKQCFDGFASYVKAKGTLY